MKKVICLFIVLCLVQSAYAQYPRYEIKASVSGFPLIELGYLWKGESVHTATNSMSGYFGQYAGPKRCTGNIGVGFDVLFTRKFALSMEIYGNMFWQDIYDNKINNQKKATDYGARVQVLLRPKLTYLSREIWSLYGSLGLGCSYGTYWVKDYQRKNKFWPALQISPIGVTVGKKVYGFAEFSLGTIGVGGTAGIGYRFY